MPVSGVGHDTHYSCRLPEHDGVGPPLPRQLEPGGDQAVADRASRPWPPTGLVFLPFGSASRHDDTLNQVDSVHKWCYCGQRPLRSKTARDEHEARCRRSSLIAIPWAFPAVADRDTFASRKELP